KTGPCLRSSRPSCTTAMPSGSCGSSERCTSNPCDSQMTYLDEIDYKTPDFADFYDELPLWSAPFGLMLLEHVSLRPGMTILDVGAGTGFITIELAQRCGS